MKRVKSLSIFCFTDTSSPEMHFLGSGLTPHKDWKSRDKTATVRDLYWILHKIPTAMHCWHIIPCLPHCCVPYCMCSKLSSSSLRGRPFTFFPRRTRTMHGVPHDDEELYMPVADDFENHTIDATLRSLLLVVEPLKCKDDRGGSIGSRREPRHPCGTWMDGMRYTLYVRSLF
jgi:hypothetical protein